MHIPADSQNLENKKFAQIVLGIQGPPGTFKTGAALTFPNPVICDFDNGLTAYAGQSKVVMPFHDNAWICAYAGGKFKNKKPEHQPNRRDAFLEFLRTDGFKLAPEQTLVVDSWTTLQDAFDAQQKLEPRYTDKGKEDDFWPWECKIKYSKEVITLLRSIRCNVVVNFHETQVRDIASGQLLDKVAPLMQGKFVAQLKLYFTDFFRATTEDEKNAAGKVVKTRFLWQVRSDNKFDAKTRLTLPDGTYQIPASYNSFTEYGYKTV